jgi:hypothetical protein
MILGFDIEIVVVFGLLVLLVYFALTKTLFKRSKKRAFYSTLITLFASPILFYISLVTYLFFGIFGPEFQKDFDQKAWQEIKGLRNEMRDDLIESDLLKNKTKNEVLSLLGEPDRIDSTGLWTYDLGVSKAGFGWQFNDLKIHFDNDRVEETELIEIID